MSRNATASRHWAVKDLISVINDRQGRHPSPIGARGLRARHSTGMKSHGYEMTHVNEVLQTQREAQSESETIGSPVGILPCNTNRLPVASRDGQRSNCRQVPWEGMSASCGRKGGVVTGRWILKRGLKWAVEWAADLSGWARVYRRSAAFQRGYRVLTYHKIAHAPEDSYTVGTGHFHAHMAFLADHHPVIGLEELVRGLVWGPLPEAGSVAVTFDDGYLECASAVSDILLKHSIPATFFVVTGILDGISAMPGGPYLTWSDVRSMHASGLSIGSHTVTHRSLSDVNPVSVRKELVESRNRIAAELGSPPVGLAYPYGTLRDVSHGIADAAQAAGYLFAATAVHGLNRRPCNPFLLKRTTLTAGDGPRTFRMIMNGCLDPWYLVDRWGHALQHGKS